jgi:hypothetical protein
MSHVNNNYFDTIENLSQSNTVDIIINNRVERENCVRYRYTGWPKSHAPEKNMNISITARANELIFL